MPVRFLNSSVLVWPDGKAVDAAVRLWALNLARSHPELSRMGYFGSYARGDWGVGSDLDLILILESADEPFEQRAARWDVTGFPVPTEVLVYTSEEWDALPANSLFRRTLLQEAVWVYDRDFDALMSGASERTPGS